MSDSTAPVCNWPMLPYLGALVFATATLALFTPALDGHAAQAARIAAQLAILAVFVGRFVLAYVRHEQSRRWIAYVVAMMLATPLWLLVEPAYFKAPHFVLPN